MAEEARERRPWDMQEGEPRRHYRRFLVYRDMGAERSVRRACEVAKVPKEGRVGTWDYWRKISFRWKWGERVRAYDEWREALAQKHADERAAELAIAEAEENVKQAGLRVDENRHLRTLGRAVALRILQVIGQGALSEMTSRKVKKIKQTTAVDGSFERDEMETKSVFELAGLAVQAIEIGQKLERLDAGKPTDITQDVGQDQGAQEIARLIAAQLLAGAPDAMTLAQLREELIGLNGKAHDESVS